MLVDAGADAVKVGRNAVEADGTFMCESMLDPVCTVVEGVDFDFEIAIGTIGDVLMGVSAELVVDDPVICCSCSCCNCCNCCKN